LTAAGHHERSDKDVVQITMRFTLINEEFAFESNLVFDAQHEDDDVDGGGEDASQALALNHSAHVSRRKLGHDSGETAL
jgi:hypothetical protein